MKKTKKKNTLKLLSYKIVIGAIGVLAIGAATLAYIGNAPKVVVEGNYIEAPGEQIFGGAGPDHYFRENFFAGLTRGGDVLATSSTASTYTLTPAEIDGDVYYISWTPNLNITVTLPATTTAAFNEIIGKDVGMTREYILYNASSTSGTITLAAGTGIDLQKNEDTANLATAALSVTKLTFIRKADTDVLVIMDQWDVAD